MEEPAGERFNRWEDIEEYYRNHGQQLQGYLRKCGASQTDAEDIVHETMIKAFKIRTKIKSLPAWCPKTAWRLWRDATLRRHRNRDVGLEQAGDNLAEQSPFPEREAWERLRTHLRKLTTMQRSVVEHRYRGFSNVEIAKLLDIKPSTVASHFRHAKSRICSYGDQ